MQRVEVHKFGGTSVGSAERIEAAARCVDGAAREARVVVVASALSGVTDELLRVCALATEGRREQALSALAGLAARHEEALGVLGEGAPAADVAAVRAELRALVDELSELTRAVSWLRELSPRTRSTILATGEKLSVRLLALALRKLGLPARALDADGFVETEGRADEAAPVHGVTERTIVAALSPRLAGGELPVVTGFCGRDAAGATTVLGRGGSDYTATLIGAALGVDEVTIWTDVDGVFTADPRVVPEARRIEQLNFREAAELSYYGAKVLHQRTIIPVATRGIPVRIKNSFAPERGGTVVDGRFTPGSHPVKAISAVRGQALISVEGKGMAGVPGVSARLFTALSEGGINVTMISQSSSESSICLAVPARDARAAELALKRAFRGAVSHGDVDDVVVRPNVGLVAAVGLGMAHMPGVAERIFGALGRHGVNILAIAQGSSELNISLAVDEADVDACIRAIHSGCGLHRYDTGEESPAGFDVLLLGCGSVGRALVELLLEREEHVHERFGLRPRVVAMADRSGFVLAPRGLLPERLRATLAHKAGGGRLAELDGARAGAGATDMVRAALEWRLRRPVLVDVSDEPGAHETYAAALELGCDVVTANKGPLAGPRAVYDELVARAAAGGRVLKAEATVGAGLPVVDTLEMLLATGDRLRSAEGCLSGTLAFLTTRMEEGQPLSDALAEAVRLGYTEPDPAVDLGGLDVRRKATILARLAGLTLADANVRTQGLVGDGLAGLPLDELLARLRAEHDAPLAARLARCQADGLALRYVARVTPEAIEVGPAAVPADGPLGMLRGPDNMVVFRSERYDERPLVVSGPGAGVQVTAMGVLSDVLRVAAERRVS